MTDVLTPFAGPVVALSDVPDPVFAGQLVGAGVAVMPPEGTDAVLVHVGIDTVKMQGDGFALLASEGDVVAAGDPIVRFEPATILAAGYSPICPVVVLGSAPDSVPQDAVGSSVDAGAVLFRV
jgi:sugar PTS system EIIA component